MKKDSKKNKSLTKLVDTVVSRLYKNVTLEKNSDYSKIFQALKKYPRGGTDFIASLLIPYVEDVVDEMEKSDKELMFSDTDITYAANTAAEIMGDRVMQAYSGYRKEETTMDEAAEDVMEGVGAYTLKKTKVEKNEDEDNGTQTIVHYDIMLGGKKVGKLKRDDYFGQASGELHGKPIPLTATGDDVQAWLHKFLKSKKGAKFAMQTEAKDCGCNDAQEEQEFMFGMKKKAKLKESLISKVKFLHKD
jgi:hypothetical protein